MGWKCFCILLRDIYTESNAMLTKKSKIFVAGHKGMVGSAILRLLKNEKYTNLITVDKKQLNLLFLDHGSKEFLECDTLAR